MKRLMFCRAHVFYDCPPKRLKRLTVREKHEFLRHLELSGANTARTTEITIQDEGTYRYKSDRPALLITSTSYTPDEDFHLFLRALALYDDIFSKRIKTKLLVVITGKGPMKDEITQVVSSLNQQLSYCTIYQLWLEPGDYPKLLGCADIGVSLHTSSSGLDLPMKIVDMFGCGVPVLASAFSSIEELVSPNETGLLFSNEQELANLLFQLTQKVSHNASLEQLRSGVVQSHVYTRRWENNWNTIVLPLLAL